MHNFLSSPGCHRGTPVTSLCNALSHDSQNYATIATCVPTNSDSSLGLTSSKSISIIFRRFLFRSSSVLPWECAPGNSGTYPMYRPVSGHLSTMAVYLIIQFFLCYSSRFFPFRIVRSKIFRIRNCQDWHVCSGVAHIYCNMLQRLLPGIHPMS